MEKSIVDFSKLSEDILDEYDIQKYDSYEDVFEDVYMDDDAFSRRDAVELLKDNSMQEVVEMQPYIYKCDGKYYRWPYAYLYEDELIVQYPFARVSENYDMDIESEPVKHKIYCFNEVSSEGFVGGNESRMHVYSSQAECVHAAYESYCEAWEEFEKNGLIEPGDIFLLKEEFTKDFLHNNYVLIQLPDSHTQFEYFEEELELQKEVAIENKIKIDLGFASLIAEKGADPNYNEIFIGLEDSNWSQDIAVIGEKYHYEGDNVIPDKGVSVKLYSDKDQEDYTHDFEIDIYEADEDISELDKVSLADKIEETHSDDLVTNSDVNALKSIVLAVPDFSSFDELAPDYSTAERFEFSTPEEFMQKYRDIEEGTWCCVFVNGVSILEGCADAEDIEPLEEFFAEGWYKTLKRNDEPSLSEKIEEASSRVEEGNKKNQANDLIR